MTLKQYIQNESIKRSLFSWSWPETKRAAYNKLLEDFLQKPEVKRLTSKREVLFYWYLYCGTLEDYILNGKTNGIVEKCPLTKKELEIIFEA